MSWARAIRWRWTVAACCVLALAAGVFARGVMARDPQLESGIRQVQEGEMATALVTLDDAIQRLSRPGAPVRELALAHVWSGIARLGLGSKSAAQESMRRAIQADPKLTLSSQEFPPHVVLMFDEIRNEVANRTAPAAAATSRRAAIAAASATSQSSVIRRASSNLRKSELATTSRR
jgi:hypothetical protein